MERTEALEKLKFLYDQVHQTAERSEHLEERMPLHVHPQSLNYEKDLTRFQGEYNRLARQAWESGLLTEYDMEQAGIPLRFGYHEE